MNATSAFRPPRRPRPRRSVTAALGSLLALAGLLAGVPLVLARAAGWPLPQRVPTADELYDGLTAPIDQMTIVKIIACVTWLVWLSFTASVLAETRAVLTGRAAGRVPFGPGRQLARRLVSTALVIATSAPAARAAATPPPSAAGVVATAPANPATVTPAATPTPPHPVYVTKLGDTLWDIAERYLGRGTEFRRIDALNAGRAMPGGVTYQPGGRILPGWPLYLPQDAAKLPADTEGSPPPGREVIARDGDHLWSLAEEALAEATGRRPTRHEVAAYWRRVVDANRDRLADPSLIRPGQRLVLPPVHDRAAPRADQPAQDPRPGHEVIVRTGDNLWSLGEAALRKALERPPTEAETAHYVGRVVDANRHRLADPDRPGLVHPGQRVTLPPQPSIGPPDTSPPSSQRRPSPAAPSSAPTSRPTTPQPSSTPVAPSAPSAPAAPTSAPAPPDDQSPDIAPIPAAGLLGVAAAGLAVAVSYSLAQRRRRHLDRLPAGVCPTPAPPDLDPLRAELASADDEGGVGAVRAALAGLAADLTARPGLAPRPRLVQAGADRIEVLLSTALLPAAPGWHADAHGAIWSRDLTPLLEAGLSAGSAAPALVTLGAPETSGQVYLDLEAEGVVSVVGDPETCTALVRSMIRELGHAEYAGPMSVVLVGDLGAALGVVDRVRAVATWEDIADDALAWAEQSRDLVTGRGAAHPFAARSADPDDGLAPLILVCADRPHAESFDQLCALVAAGNTTVTVLVVGDELSGATRIELDPTTLSVPSLGLTCRPQTLSADADRQIGALLDHADQAAAEPIPAPTLPDPETGAARADDEPSPRGSAGLATGSGTATEHAILVRLLGPIAVEGTAAPLTPQQTAVVAYIALHQPVSADTLEDAVWSQPTASRRRRRINTVSECRAALGPQHFPIAAAGRYTLGPQVRTDLDLFDQHVARAAHQPPKQAAVELRAALALVSGPVFTYRNVDRGSYVWVDLEYWPSNTETRVTDAALRLAELCQQTGDSDGFVWAAQRGLLASPTHAALTEALMRAYADTGDRAAAEHVYRSHRAALEDLDLDEVAETTAELYERIRHRERAS